MPNDELWCTDLLDSIHGTARFITLTTMSCQCPPSTIATDCTSSVRGERAALLEPAWMLYPGSSTAPARARKRVGRLLLASLAAVARNCTYQIEIRVQQVGAPGVALGALCSPFGISMPLGRDQHPLLWPPGQRPVQVWYW